MDSIFTKKEESERRYAICKDCYYFSKGYKFFNWTLKIEKCNDCGCPIKNKITINLPKCHLH